MALLAVVIECQAHRAARRHRGTDRLAKAAPASQTLLLGAAARGNNLGAITAALFMRRFVTAKSWLHFDLFAWTPTAKPGRPEGGECQSARALYALLAARYG